MPASAAENCTDFKVELNFPSIRYFVTLLVVGPVVVLFCCFVPAKIFQNEKTYNDFHTCHNIKNFIPSISGVIGLVPQIYFWRICIAFVAAPKIFLFELYRVYFVCLANTLRSERIKKVTQWLSLICFWCNFVDTVALCGLSFVSNREDHVIHEKFFIIFMVSSFLNMVLVLSQFMAFKDHLPRAMLKSLRTKLIIFFFAVFMALIMIYFYMLHATWCIENAFSWFSLCEYGMTFCILCFHWSIVMDFPNKRFKLEVIDA